MTMKFLLIALFVVGVNAVQDVTTEFPKPPITFDPNEYVDDVLTRVKEYIYNRNLDPYTAFNEQLFSVNVTGRISGLGTLARAGDALVHYKPGKQVVVDTKLRVHDLRAKLNWHTKILLIPVHGTAEVTIQDVVVDGKLTTALPKVHFTVDKFDIARIGHISTELDVLPIFDHVVSAVSDVIINLSRNMIGKIFRGPIQTLVQEALNKLAIPTEE